MISSGLNLNLFTDRQFFNTGFGHEKSVRHDGPKEPRDWAEGQKEVCVLIFWTAL